MSEPVPDDLLSRLKARYAAGKLLTTKHFLLFGLLMPALVSGYRALRHDEADETVTASFDVGVLPSCTSSTARQLLFDSLHDSPDAKQAGVKVAKIGEVKETGFVPVNSKGSEMRLCTADVFLNVGRKDVNFTLQWTSTAKDEVWIEAEQPF